MADNARLRRLAEQQIEAPFAKDVIRLLDETRDLDARDLLLEFGQWLSNERARVTDLADAMDEDDPEAFVALVDAFLSPSGVGGNPE